MQTAATSPYSFDCVSAGVDWITCTATGKDARTRLESAADGLLHEEAARGVEITPGRIRDYVGWQAPGIFAGKRQSDSLVRLSASHALAHWQTVAREATNVSRLDLQVTVWTHGEQPALSRWYYQRVRRLPPQRGRPRSFSLIQTHPHGDTLYVGKRQSDCFGRVYDYATAHKKAEPRTLWRYEVELKRHVATNHANSLLGERVHQSRVEQIVGSWFETRGIHPAWSINESPHLVGVSDREIERDVLRWFDTSLSKTVARAIRRYGVAAVVESLHLSPFVIVKRQRR
jgi:hypothetical protein